MLTIFFASATFLQSWRIKKICNKISEQLALHSSIAFYELPERNQIAEGFSPAVATSELCIHRSSAKISEILWMYGNYRGCCVSPMQMLNITPWITFPEAPNLIPFAYTQPPERLLKRLAARKDLLYLLLETDLPLNNRHRRGFDVVRVEEYGKLIAWKIDSHLAILIETDVEHLTKLLIMTFLQNSYFINDQLPLIRIQSLNVHGKPQPFELVSNHLRKVQRTSERLNEAEWRKHLNNLKALCVLASQAHEFEYNKNLTEGKTGVVKPDLIPAEKRLATEKGLTSNAVTTTATVTTVTATSTTNTKGKPTSTSASLKEKPAEGKSLDKVINPIVATASTTTVAPIKTTTSPAAAAATTTGKLKAKPTEIKKPTTTVVDGTRFRTTKVTESPTKTTTTTTTAATTAAAAGTSTTPSTTGHISPVKTSPAKISELEKIAAVAAAAAVAQKEKSPIKQATPIASKTKSSDIGDTATKQTIDNSPISVIRDNTKRPSLKRDKDILINTKPLNIMVYSDSATSRDNTVETLKSILEKDMYTIYPMSLQQAEQRQWFDTTALLVVCGSVPSNIGEILVHYFLKGGKVISLCSDILHFILPNYRTAEVREHELVQFSYDKWKKIKMMHHIFCYQPSPVKKNFSTDSEESTQSTSKKPAALLCPRSIELKDFNGEFHNLDVKVLGTEETWNTPSLLLANSVKSGGKAVFSQVHLELQPSQFEADEIKYSILKQNDKIRLEIFADLLAKHLNFDIKKTFSEYGSGAVAAADVATNSAAGDGKKVIYKNAYFLGRYESKSELLEKLKDKFDANKVIKTTKLTMAFCGKDDKPPNANTNLLPILIHSCPDDFSTVEYYDNLKTKDIGRLVIYTPVISSSQFVIDELELTHGIVVLPRQQTDGVGRSNNQWISPLGCAMFSVQLHLNLNSTLGERLPLLQHVIGVAMVNALKGNETYKNLNIGVKWPNDIYCNGIMKIGGLVIRTTILGTKVIANIGCGLNLDNSKPTTCINDIINEYNQQNQQRLPLLKYEKLLALIFNEIERIFDELQSSEGYEKFYELYYALWLHNDQAITICDKDGKKKDAHVIGIDDYGFLKVKLLSTGAIETVQPDGNSFDMLKGLIVPKFH